MGQKSKSSNKIFLPAVAANNQSVSQTKVIDDSCNYSVYEVGIGLESDPVYSKAMTSIIPTDVRMIDEGSDCTSQDNGEKTEKKMR